MPPTHRMLSYHLCTLHRHSILPDPGSVEPVSCWELSCVWLSNCFISILTSRLPTCFTRYRKSCKEGLFLSDVICISQSRPCLAQRSCNQQVASKHFCPLDSFSHATWHLDTLHDSWAEPLVWIQVCNRQLPTISSLAISLESTA